MKQKMIQIAIDGPAGAGKSTVAREVAKELGYVYLDTGAMYRAVGYTALTRGMDLEDEAALSRMMDQLVMTVEYRDERTRIGVDGRDVTDLIRTDEVSQAASSVSRWKSVRLKMVELQRRLAQHQSTVLDGRDIGTFVLPRARYKFYLTATVAERARRRWQEQQARGVDKPLEAYEEMIKSRDHQDMSRDFAPLRQAEDAILVDSTGMTPHEVVTRMVNVVRKDEYRDNATLGMRVFYKIARTIVFFMVHIATPYRVVGNRNLRQLKGPWLVCPNHVAQWDALLTAEMLLPRKTSFMAKSSLFNHGFMNWIITALGAIPVHRGEADTAAIKKALGALADGKVFAVFPEGTRNLKQDGSLLSLQSGASLIAMKAKVPVLPIYIHSGGRYRFLRSVTIYVGEPVELSDLAGKRVNASLLEQVTGRIAEQMEQLREKAQKTQKNP